MGGGAGVLEDFEELLEYRDVEGMERVWEWRSEGGEFKVVARGDDSRFKTS